LKIILISGKAQHGKDTTANILKTLLEKDNKRVLIAHYGDLVKYVCKTFFGWNGEKDEYGRSLLQRIGTDEVRKVFPNFWVHFIKDMLTIFPNEWDYVLIPDTRFLNEVQVFKNSKWDTITLRVHRLNFISPLTIEQQNHPSETALDNYIFDYYINSEFGLDKLEVEVNKFVKEMNSEV
jgi:hypothetical protein